MDPLTNIITTLVGSAFGAAGVVVSTWFVIKHQRKPKDAVADHTAIEEVDPVREKLKSWNAAEQKGAWRLILVSGHHFTIKNVISVGDFASTIECVWDEYNPKNHMPDPAVKGIFRHSAIAFVGRVG